VRCFDAGDGRPLWTFKAGGDVDSPPVIAGGAVVFGSADGRVYAVRLDDGREIWRREIGGRISCSPAVIPGAVLVATEDGWLHALGDAGNP
jgi:outer membrane protein assembly factor BamB